MGTQYSQPPALFVVRLLHFWRRVTRSIDKERRGEVQIKLREASRPGFDFFLLVILSCTIATMGLLTNSAAIIIGAMLVAPLMSPIIGLGLASITGDQRLLRFAGAGLVQGAFLAVLVSFILRWFNRQLPFILLQELPNEILARTHPSPIGLTVALAGGLAAAYALAQPTLSAALPGVALATALMPPLCTIGIGGALERWDVAGGALLLFVTNAVAIAFAATLVFFSLGFGPRPLNNSNRLPHSLLISALLTIGLLVPLTYLSVNFVQQAAQTRQIENIVKEEIEQAKNSELVEMRVQRISGILNMNITIRSTQLLNHQNSVEIQESIAGRLQQPVDLVINQVIAARLDPKIPPTLTSTPTNTPTATPTPSIARVAHTLGRGLRLRQFPEGPIIGTLREGDKLIVMYGYEVMGGCVCVGVQDAEGRFGWVPEMYIAIVIPSPTPSGTPSASAMP